jgi:hypothetical protein
LVFSVNAQDRPGIRSRELIVRRVLEHVDTAILIDSQPQYGLEIDCDSRQLAAACNTPDL